MNYWLGSDQPPLLTKYYSYRIETRMPDTLWSDISEFQVPVTNAYPYQVLAIRSNDGSYHDKHFEQNWTWAMGALANGKLAALIVYYFWRPDGSGATTHMNIVGPMTHTRVATMIDVESGSGVSTDHSNEINNEYNNLVKWHGGDERKVIGYGNVYDLNSIWPRRPAGIKLIIAAYGSNPSFPGKWAHQYMDNHDTPPFGPSDFNSADGLSLDQVLKDLGMPAPNPPRATAG